MPRSKRVRSVRKKNLREIRPSQKLFEKLLLAWNPDSFPRQKINVLKRFCQKHQLNWHEIKASDVFAAVKQLRKKADDFEYLILIGDERQFPSYKFTHMGFISHTDFIYNITTHLKVGRIIGGTKTISEHLHCSASDSKLAVVIDTSQNRSENSIQKLEALGYQVFHWQGANGQSFKLMEPLLEQAQMIFQCSDGTAGDQIRGNAKEWCGGIPPRPFFTYKDLKKIEFSNYPFIFSEACMTANFGPFIRAMCEATAAYIGASCNTYENHDSSLTWSENLSSNGFKDGVLDQLNRHQTVGDLMSHVLQVMTESLPASSQRFINEIEKGKPLEIQEKSLISIIEWVFFGNPLRSLKMIKSRTRQKKS
ncbi:MAG: hypothetical protein ACXQS8_07835 [Candidatus Helarchaeales archaeon]